MLVHAGPYAMHFMGMLAIKTSMFHIMPNLLESGETIYLQMMLCCQVLLAMIPGASQSWTLLTLAVGYHQDSRSTAVCKVQTLHVQLPCSGCQLAVNVTSQQPTFQYVMH